MTGDDDLINDLVEGAQKDYEHEKSFRDRYRTNALPDNLQRIKEEATALVTEVSDAQLLEPLGLSIYLSTRIDRGVGDDEPIAAAIVLQRVIDDERERRGLPDPDDYIDEDEERWTEAIAELPHDATAEEIEDAILGSDIEHGLYDDD